jgi:hypothetical protein
MVRTFIAKYIKNKKENKMDSKKCDVLVENGICKNMLTVWADDVNVDIIKTLPGITNVFNTSSETQYDVWVDPRYDVERVKGEIYTLLSKSSGGSASENTESNNGIWTIIPNWESHLENIKFEDEENILEDFEPYDIIFQPERKTTIVIWEDGSKTIVKCHDDEFSKEFGLAMALAKKIYGRGRFLQLVENADIQHTTEKKRKESPKTEYAYELGNQSKDRMTVQDACKKCFEVAEAADDIYDMISKIGEGTFVPNRNSNYSA